ncbi:MAG: hypothetical protein OHK0048_14940 [Rhodoferax sp.]
MDDKDKKLLITAIKLTLGIVVFLILVGLGLYYTAKFQTYAPPEQPPKADWGIANDSPIRSNR